MALKLKYDSYAWDNPATGKLDWEWGQSHFSYSDSVYMYVKNPMTNKFIHEDYEEEGLRLLKEAGVYEAIWESGLDFFK